MQVERSGETQGRAIGTGNKRTGKELRRREIHRERGRANKADGRQLWRENRQGRNTGEQETGRENRRRQESNT